MAGEKFVTIGHVCNDITPIDHIGGGVTYSAATAKKCGIKQVDVITKCFPGYPHLQRIKDLDINVKTAKTNSNRVTTFGYKYDKNGNRKFTCLETQRPINLKNLESLPRDYFDDAVVLVAPVTPHDVKNEIFSYLANRIKINLIPQGYFREIKEDGEVLQNEWKKAREILPYIDTAILSEEDLIIKGNPNNVQRDQIINIVPMVAITKGSKGVEIFENGKKTCETKAFPVMKKEIVDFTGAGDVFATIFILEMAKNGKDIKAASIAACLFAAMKIMGVGGGIGIDSIPKHEQIKNFISNNKERVKNYLKSEGLESSKVLFHVLK